MKKYTFQFFLESHPRVMQFINLITSENINLEESDSKTHLLSILHASSSLLALVVVKSFNILHAGLILAEHHLKNYNVLFKAK